MSLGEPANPYNKWKKSQHIAAPIFVRVDGKQHSFGRASKSPIYHVVKGARHGGLIPRASLCFKVSCTIIEDQTRERHMTQVCKECSAKLGTVNKNEDSN